MPQAQNPRYARDIISLAMKSEVEKQILQQQNTDRNVICPSQYWWWLLMGGGY